MMKNIIQSSLTILLLVITTNSNADYPIVSHRYLADPSAMVYDGRVYLYCSNDDDNTVEGGYNMSSIVCVSSSDLKNWTDHGVVFNVPRDASWASLSWAPSAVERDGQFYLYFPNGASNIGVAVSDSPTGPFTDPIGGPLVDASTPGVLPADNIWIFDPMTFIDDDGQAYMYFGGNGEDNMRIIKLNDDMISTDGAATTFTVPNFFEAAYMHKRNDIYYLTYSTLPGAGLRIDYMMSDNPTTGFTYGGILSGQPPENNNNNHQAIFELNGNWYQAYHNRAVAMEAGIPPVYKRNLGVDQFFYNEDGTIQTMQHTVDGVDQLGTLNPYERVEAETMSDQNGIYTEPHDEFGMNLSEIDDGDWIKVDGVDFGTQGPAAFTASLSSEFKFGFNTDAQIDIRIDSPDGTSIGSVPVSYTGGSDLWKTETIATEMVSGVHDVYFIFSGDAENNLFEFDYWYFTERTGNQNLLGLNAEAGNYKIDTASGFNTTPLSVTAVYENGTAEDVTNNSAFAFDEAGILSITDGVITGLSQGEVTITATYENHVDSIIMVVKNLESELTVAELQAVDSDIQLFTGGVANLSIDAVFEDGHTEGVTDEATYENSNPSIASVTDAGVISAIAEGQTEITVSYQGELGDPQSIVIQVTVAEGIGLWLEAECGEVGSNWQVIEDASASNGTYVTVQAGTQSLEGAPSGAENLISIPFEVAVTGTYLAYFRVTCPSPDDDSFWIRMDDGNYTLWNGIEGSSDWIWTEFPNTFDLSEGSHTLTVGYREDGALLDKIWLTNAGGEITSLGGEAENCESDPPDPVVLGETNGEQDELLVYPNAADNQLNFVLNTAKGQVSWEILDLSGRSHLHGLTTKDGGHSLDVSALAEGVYILKVSKNGKTYSERFVVK